MFGENSSQKELREKWSSMSEGEKWDTFLWKMSWYHSNIHIPGNPNQAIENLTKELKNSSKSSEDLTKSIRNATWVASIVGGLGVIVGIINLFK